MHYTHLLKTSFTGLKTNKTRSLLTILGIVIGISSIIVIFSIGKGTENLILDELGGFGAETIVIRPGQEPEGLSDIAESIFQDSLTIKDVEALKRKNNVPHLAKIAPAVIVPGNVTYKGESFGSFNFGWTAELLGEMFRIELESGILFGDREIRNKASVAVIGSDVRDELFGMDDPLGKNIKLKGRNFKVIGVMLPKGQVTGFNVDELVVIPYSTAQSYLLGIDYFHEIITKATAPEFVERTVDDIKATIRENHGLSVGDNDDFFVVTQEGMVEQISTILDLLTYFLASVVAIALVVGGVGVMNIMLVSVMERTKEIGLRKAIGATNGDIMTQFLVESIILTSVGGVIGILFGAGISFLITILIQAFTAFPWAFTFPIGASILGIAVSASIGIIFGIYPAKQASKKSPIEALRH